MNSRLLKLSYLFLFCATLLISCESEQAAAALKMENSALILTDSADYQHIREDFTENETSYSQTDIVLSSKEMQLDSLLKKMLNKQYQQYYKSHRHPSSLSFYEIKAEMEQTDLFHLLQKMPKGAILHLHDMAMGDAMDFVEEAKSREDVYVFWEEDEMPYIKGQLNIFSDKSKIPDGFFQVKTLSKSETSFDNELYRLLILDDKILASDPDVWKLFEKQFGRRLGLLNYREFFIRHYSKAFEKLIADGIMHAEVRSILSNSLFDPAYPDRAYPADSMVVCFEEALRRVTEKHPRFSLKIIHTGIRFWQPSIVKADYAKGFRLRKQFPNMVVGYDLVGQEDAGYSTLRYWSCWKATDSLEKHYGVKLPLFLHDGESIRPGNHNMVDALMLNSRRIGHGINLYRFPKLMDLVKSRDVAIEVSPLSNQILGYVADLRNHPAAYYIAQGIPITINSDDPGIFQNHGLSYDYWAAIVAWGLDLKQLKTIVRNSLIYSTLEGEEKTRKMADWEKDWERWVEDSL